jgi:hypothetical protein
LALLLSVFRTIPALTLRIHVYSGVRVSASCGARGYRPFGVDETLGAGVGDGGWLANALGCSWCRSEYVTAKETVTRQPMAVAIKALIHGDIRFTSAKGKRIIA